MPLLAAVSGTTVTLGDGSTTTIPDLTDLDVVERSMSPGAGFLHDLFDPNLAFIFFWVGLLLIIIETDRARAHLRGHHRDDPVADLARLVRIPAGPPDRRGRC